MSKVELTAQNGESHTFKFEFNTELNAECAAKLEDEMNKIIAVQNAAKSKLLPQSTLDRMVEESLHTNEDDDEEEQDEVNEEDMNDPELLGELANISGEAELTQPTEEAPQVVLPTSGLDNLDLIKKRLELYQQAATKALEMLDEAKARRFERGLKTLNELLEQANAGKCINIDDIPPEVSLKEITCPATENALKRRAEENPLAQQLRDRQREYRAKAFEYKRAEDSAKALQYFQIAKQLEVALKMSEQNPQLVIDNMPPSAEQFLEFLTEI